ncbi:MAG: AtpZ/AtpI family protein [Pseudomonadota bacterium]
MSGRSGDRTGDNAKRLEDLDRRIADARDAGKPKPRGDKEKFGAMSFAWRVTIELVVSIMIGAAMGWGLDSLFGTLPVFLVVFCLLGFASGVRTMMRSVAENQRRDAARAAEDEIES